jgi:predicted nucleotidyltransferase
MAAMQAFAHKRQQIVALCQRNHIVRLGGFGSAARNEQSPDSDIDLLVEFQPGHASSLAGMARLRQAFTVMLNAQRVDLATPSILRNPYRRKAILAELKELYAA